jgi:uncharacterized protein
MTATAAQAQIGTGSVRHTRLRPVLHRFVYPTWFLLLPMRTLRTKPEPSLPRNRFALASFHDCDHGDGRTDSLAWLDELLAAEHIGDARGEVWLQTYPRVLGYAFKPVSFWYCHRTDDTLAAVVVEVNNTFGERHCYLLTGAGLAFGRSVEARKVFHVSPFCRVDGSYRFRFLRTDMRAADITARGIPARTLACIDHHDAAGALIRTSLSGNLAPLTAARLRRAFFAMPLLTLGVVARIHWQALRLWCRRVPFFAKPAPPAAGISRHAPASEHPSVLAAEP